MIFLWRTFLGILSVDLLNPLIMSQITEAARNYTKQPSRFCALKDMPIEEEGIALFFDLLRTNPDTRHANIRDRYELLLDVAAFNGHEKLIQLLLDHGVDIHVLDDSPLRNAVAEGRLRCVELLLNHGANVHAGNEAPLKCALERLYYAIAKILSAYGADHTVLKNKKLIKRFSREVLGDGEGDTKPALHF